MTSLEDARLRVDSVKSRNKEGINVKMEFIIETHENQEADENSHSNNDCKSSI